VKENAQNETTSTPSAQNVTKEWSVSRVDGVALPFCSGPSEDIQDMAEYLVAVDVRLGDQLAVIPSRYDMGSSIRTDVNREYGVCDCKT
jgi:hypothetical protein